MIARTACLIVLCCLQLQTAHAEEPDRDTVALAASVAELQQAVGTWSVVTEFLNPDGSVARSVEGTYSFEWVVPDRVVSGTSTIPDLDQQSAILFYVNESARTIEMVSVGADGKLWVMTGELGGNTRTTPEFETAGGGKSRLRFTRSNVTPDRFESRMEYLDEPGNWVQGNHQVFIRSKPRSK